MHSVGGAQIGAFVKYPVVFSGGWLFDFIVDIQFMSGFAAGCPTNTWVGNLLL